MVAAEAPKQANSASVITAANGERFSMETLEIPQIKMNVLAEATCFSASRSKFFAAVT